MKTLIEKLQTTRPRHDFRILLAGNGQFYWVYYDGNYEALVTSELYSDYSGAMRGLNNFKVEMGFFYKNK